MPRHRHPHPPLVHPLEPRRLLAAVAVADLSLSDIPDSTAPSGVAVGDTFYFTRAADSRANRPAQLWASDGTPDATRPVADLGYWPQSGPFFAHGGRAYFVQSAPDLGSPIQLWWSDGTAAGTAPVADLGVNFSNGPAGLSSAAVGDAVYVSSDVNLLRIDSDSPRGRLVRGITALSPADFDGTLHFLNGGLWASDGTSAGTVRRVTLDPTRVAPSPIVTAGGAMYFVHNGDAYRSDGTAEGTHLLRRGEGDPRHASGHAAATTAGRVFFTSDAEGHGTELFTTDGTPEGTTLLKDVRPGPDASGLRDFAVVGETLYFVADDGVHGAELWKSDGTAEGTTRVADLSPGFAGSAPEKLTAHDGRLYFTADHPSLGRELFTTDGTAAGTRAVADLFPGAAGSLPQAVVPGAGALAGKLLITALDPAAGYSAFSIDAPGAAPAPLADLIPGPLNRQTSIAGTDDGRVLYADGDATTSGREPFALDPGAPGSATLVRDVQPGPAGSNPSGLVTVAGDVYFSATTAAHGTEVWKSDGADAALLKDVLPADAGSYSSAHPLRGFGGERLFINYHYWPHNSAYQPQAWTSTGTEATTTKLADANLGPLVEFKDALYYLDSTTSSASLVRMSRDGASRQTVKVLATSAYVDPYTTVARDLTAVGDFLYFSVANEDYGGRTLWRSDGTAAGTTHVYNVEPGNDYFPVGFAQVRGNLAVFSAVDVGIVEELWVTNGTASGTHPIRFSNAGGSSCSPRSLTSLGGFVYFTASDPASGVELWRTDGSRTGTVLVKDIVPGPGGAAPASLKVVGGKLYFVATDASGGRELWTTDGSAAGTVRVQDINPGPGSSDPMNLTDVSGDLYFTANDGTSPKLYRLGSPAPQVVGRHVFYNNSSFDGRTSGAGPADDGAVAPDKSALLPGQAATFANVTSYAKGLNGVMIDLAGRPGRPLRPEDFEVRVSRGGDAAQWTAGPAPSSVTVRRLPGAGAGPGGVDRVTLVWPDGAIRNAWAQVTVKANWNTALAADDVFTFGNLVGDTGGPASPAAPPGAFSVNAADYLATRAAQRRRVSPASPHDFDRNGVINVLDLAHARAGAGTTLAAPTARDESARPVAAAGSVSVQASGISGTVFHDADNDGTFDAGEAGVSGRRVWLDADNDRVFDTGETNVTTGADGRYAFAGLAAGTYNVRSVPPSGWNPTAPGTWDARVVTVADGQNATGVNFGSIPATSVGTIYGFPFDDVNANGLRETGERHLVPGRVVYLDDDNDGVLDPGERSRTTQVDGFFFTNLLPGTYVVRLVTPEGMRQTTPQGGAPHVVTVFAGAMHQAEFGVAPLPMRVDLPAAADAYVRSNTAFATTNFGESPDLVVKTPSVNFDGSRETYLRFDLTNVTTFSTAKLRLFGGASAGGETLPVGVFPVPDVAWDETTINWTNKPTTSLSPVATTSVAGTAARWYEWNVGDYLRQRKAAGATAVSFVLRATQARTIDATFRSAESSDNSLRPRLALDAGPLVNDVIVSSSKWTTRFLTHLRTAGHTPVNSDLGYGLPSDTTSLVRLPWVNLDRISIRFNEHAVVRSEDLQVGGVNGRTYPVVAFGYNPQTFVATWTLARPLESDRVSVSLSGAVTDRGGTPIGGAGYFRGSNVEPGDATRDLRVNGTDIHQIRARHGRTTLRPGTGANAYSIFHDLTGDGVINVLDVAAARRFA